MFRIVFVITMLVTAPAYPGDNAMTKLVPEKWKQSVFEVTCQELHDCCGIYRACGGYATGPLQPAPVPLPAPIYLLTAAIAALIWKGSKHG
jgi:hypothetical protein